ncbi:DUF6355 family natural product biosynthesis protein [Streptomyces sp. NPDC018019]|uniref:DUF6355 family natural product biosynthesis protein n=1 Tax=Streptomyces sp. NPDC018019 TaxID=3365030 RepID=UPI0037992F45
MSRRSSAPRPSPSACPSRPPPAPPPPARPPSHADYERCVGPGVTWLGSAGKIDGARYVGRTC